MLHSGPHGYGHYWGKARPDDSAALCHLLAHHSLDVAAVGIEALQRLPALRGLFETRLGLSPQLITSKGGVYAVVRSVEEARAWAESMRSSSK